MTKHIARIGTAAALILTLASFTGSAIAGNGNGSTPPGQEKKADQVAPAAQPAGSNPSAPGQVKQAAKASTSTAGVKPSNATTGVKPTHCSTGGTPSAATCAGNGPKADGSKQYGNGKTAAQIAVSRGAPSGTVLTGPGNSQPHKVTVCGKPNNKSGGVDVHAVKNYSAAECTQSSAQSAAIETKSDCTGTTVTSTSTQTVYANKHGEAKAHGNAGQHGKHEGLTSSQQNVVTSTFTPSNANCGEVAGTTATTAGATLAGTTGTPALTEAPAVGQTGTQATTAGAVLGAQANLARPATKPAGGVLGATARLANGTLPFTGLPLWLIVLAALALIGGGLAVRSARPTPQH